MLEKVESSLQTVKYRGQDYHIPLAWLCPTVSSIPIILPQLGLPPKDPSPTQLQAFPGVCCTGPSGQFHLAQWLQL